ncbi:MAG: hypothetical protein IPH36_09615 [Saprospiraceae bacterium]|nr:hypothetical protein [Saprospiraceae bacterium]
MGTKRDRDVQTYRPIVDKINAFAEEYKNLSNDGLRNNTLRFKERIAQHLEGIDKDINRLKERFLPNRTWVPKNTYTTRLMGSPKKRDTHFGSNSTGFIARSFATGKGKPP